MCRSPLTLFTPFGIHGDKMHSLDPYDGSDENGQHGGLSGKEWLRARFLSDAIPATSLAAWATYVDAGGEGVSGLQADVLVEEEVNAYDDQDRLRRTDYLDGTSATNHYSCCRLLWRRDREGRRVLRSAVTGEDHLYYAEEDAWIREIANGGHRTTQHFMDALGRETNTVVYVAQAEGEAVDWTASNQARAAGSAAVATAAYPLGTDDFVVRVDERGRTTTNETSYAQSAVTTVETVTTNDVFVLKTINVSTRGGGSTTRREWTAASGVPAGGPSSPTAAWTQTSRGTSYDQYGCRVETVMEFSHDAPYGTVTSTSTYDFLGRLVASSRPGMNSSTLVTTTTYDGATSRRISSATTGSLPTTFAYNALGEMCASTCDGVSYTSDVSYGEDSGGRILRMTATHRQVGTATPVQTGLTCEQLNCHAHGILYCTETSGEDGMTTTEIIYPDVFTLEVGNEEFEVAGRFTFRQTGNGTPEESFSYCGLTLAESSAEGARAYEFDAMGRRAKMSHYDSTGLTVDSYDLYQYDLSGNVTAHEEHAGMRTSTTRHVYDAFGREAECTNAVGGVTKTFYDALGRAACSGGDQYPVTASYDGAGRRTVLGTTRDGGLNWDETSWTYDQATGLKTAKTYADNSQVLYTYTGDGKPVRTTWARGAWKENSYDLNGRLSGTTYSDQNQLSVSYSYGDAGLMMSADTDNTFIYDYAYDGHLQCTEEEFTSSAWMNSGYAFTLDRSFDANMRPSATSVEHGNEVYASHVRTYDAEGRVSTHVLTPWLPPTYGSNTYTPLQITVGHSEGRPVSLTYAFPCGYGMTVSISREPGSGIETGRNYVFDDYRSIYSLSNTRDALSRPVAATDSFSGGWSFAYNNRSELTAAICPYYGSTGTPLTGGPCLYSYDTIGNRTASTVSAVTNSYTANALNQYTYVDSTALTYDADGNLTGDGRYSYAYDCENRLVSATPTSPQFGDFAMENAYDHRSRRVQKTVWIYDGEDWLFDRQHTFVWDGWNIVLERIDYADFDVRFIEYYWGDDLSGSEQGAGGVGGLLAVSCDGTFYVPFYDCNGNIMGYVDEFGSVVARYAYDPFGNPLTPGGIGSRFNGYDLIDYLNFGFSTKYHDREVGLVAYQLRSYSPRLGRWLNRDSIEEAGGVNLYAFCVNGVVFQYDILGLSAFVLVYDSADPMFKTWAEDTRCRILAGTVSRFNSKLARYNPQKDTIHMISVNGVADIFGLASIKDIKYLASFGHGRDGKIWWGYMDSSGTGRSVATGISGNRILIKSIARRVSLSNLVLNFDKCGFVVELYHYRSGEDLEVDGSGRLLFKDNLTTVPQKATFASVNTASVASALSGLLKIQFPNVPFSVVGSELGISDGYWRILKGWPRPVGGIKRIEVTK